MSEVEEDAPTKPYDDADGIVVVQGGRIEVVRGRARVRLGTDPILVGRAARCGLVLNDPTVSKVHLELQATPRGVRATDLKSSNGTSLWGTRISEVYLTGPCELRLGAQRLRFVPEPARQVVANRLRRFGDLIGTTPEMLELFEKLGRYSPTSRSIVIHGETGTGKERVAQAIHRASPRAQKRLLAVNCAAFTESMLDGELFGHERGAFTGAVGTRDGLFVEADGSTLLFDEVGEMSPAMQAKLLRVLETQEVRGIGSRRSRRVDVRVLFATHVDLRHAVNTGKFREDLYFRVAQATVTIPPLRQRLADLRLLIDDILERLERKDVIIDDAGMAALLAHSWPGNVRELVNVLEAALLESTGSRLMVEQVLGANCPMNESTPASLPYEPAKEEFDRNYYRTLHERYGGNILEDRKGCRQAARDGKIRPASSRAPRLRYHLPLQALQLAVMVKVISLGMKGFQFLAWVDRKPAMDDRLKTRQRS